MMVLMRLLAACAAASSVSDQLAAMVRAADDSSGGRPLRDESDLVTFSWQDAKGGAHTTVLERMDAAICGPQPCWLLTSAAVGRTSTKLIDISEMPELPGRPNSHVLPLLPTVLVPGEQPLPLGRWDAAGILRQVVCRHKVFGRAAGAGGLLLVRW